MLRNACKMELEGVVSKLKDGKYRSGRNTAWLKVTYAIPRNVCSSVGLAYDGLKFDGMNLARRKRT